MENAVNRESYSLAAGLALGLVMLEVTLVDTHEQNNNFILISEKTYKNNLLCLE